MESAISHSKCASWLYTSSAWRQMLSTVFTVSTGYFPRRVSAPSMTPSTLSSTRLATSVASALHKEGECELSGRGHQAWVRRVAGPVVPAGSLSLAGCAHR